MSEPSQLYFAYGSNMASARIGARLPAARCVGTARLREHRLSFAQQCESDGSGKCDATWTGDEADLVWGVLYALAPEDFRRLDEFEGPRYQRRQRTCLRTDGRAVEAQLYEARAEFLNPAVLPWDWYRRHVLEGAREHELPAEYCAVIEAQIARPDPDVARRQRELAIYSRSAGFSDSA